MYDINNELKQKIKLHVLRKRCNRCYAQFSNNCLIYFCNTQIFQEKTRFAIDRKPTGNPVENCIRYPFTNALITNGRQFLKSFAGSRISLEPVKERDQRRVLSIEIYCSKCANFRLIEIDLDGFLSKSFSRSSTVNPEEESLIEEDEE